MSNPTIGNESQFNNPFNILPDNIYTNPTLGLSQFTNPYDILPNISLTQKNPTFTRLGTQFTDPFDILPNPSLITKNPTTGNDSQFTTPLQQGNYNTFDILPNPSLITKNPTYNQNIQFTTPLQQGNYNTFDILPNPSLITKNPTANITTDQFSRQNTEQNIAYSNWSPQSAANSNISSDALASFAASTISGRSGIPFASQIISTIGANSMSTPYKTLPFDKLNLLPGIKYSDFRSRLPYNMADAQNPNNILHTRADGGFSAIRNVISGRRPWKSIAYAAASATPAGAYSLFNLNASGKFGYGYGDHDNPSALRNDFTIGSETTTIWLRAIGKKRNPGRWIPSPSDNIIPFNGDKVNVIDFGQRTFKNAYKWKPSIIPTDTAIGRIVASDSITQDFIKFFFTGPKLQNGLPDATDDIMVFRAVITSLGDSFNANWNGVTMIGRADPNYHYTGYSRDLSLNFDVYATTRDELKPIYRKLNALAGYTAPEYNSEDIALRAPWMRITIGDLFHQQPVVLNSLNFDYSTDASWEINIEDDQTNMQVPFKISVTCQMNVIMDYLPQKGGRFLSLAKRYTKDALPIEGSDNWLSDQKGNLIPETEVKEERQKRRIKRLKETGAQATPQTPQELGDKITNRPR